MLMKNLIKKVLQTGRTHKAKSIPLIVFVLIFIFGYFLGGKNQPSKIVEKIKIKRVVEYKEKIVEVKVFKKNRSEKVNELITISKDGTKTIKREILKINKDELNQKFSKSSNHKEKFESKKTKKITNNKFNVSLFTVFKSPTNIIDPEYGLLLQKNFILDFNVGVGFTTKKNVLLSVGYNF